MHVRRDVLVLLSLILSFSLFASAQVSNAPKSQFGKSFKLLSPYVIGGYEVLGKGFKIHTGLVGAGIDLGTHKFTLVAEGTAENSRGSLAKAGPVYSGVGYLSMRVGQSWHLGRGAQWSRVIGADPWSVGWKPVVVLEKEVAAGKLTMRTQALYVLPTSRNAYERHFSEISCWIPVAGTAGHLMLRPTFGFYRYPAAPMNTAEFLRIALILRF